MIASSLDWAEESLGLVAPFPIFQMFEILFVGRLLYYP